MPATTSCLRCREMKVRASPRAGRRYLPRRPSVDLVADHPRSPVASSRSSAGASRTAAAAGDATPSARSARPSRGRCVVSSVLRAAGRRAVPTRADHRRALRYRSSAASWARASASLASAPGSTLPPCADLRLASSLQQAQGRRPAGRWLPEAAGARPRPALVGPNQRRRRAVVVLERRQHLA